MNPKILHIMPANDWYALISDDEGSSVGYEPLTCFALVQSEHEANIVTEVRPMVWVDTAMVFADELEGFIDLERLEEIGDDLDELEEDQ
ncbi:hypothetical protein [Halothiobacillus sp. DCM-1]|uniref:hypothetical protein n=1 Tax=Halothiobacillus sp. DCM-1 TaxID=3112558 RepID=UPI00324C99BC